jgi:hypothetical protein
MFSQHIKKTQKEHGKVRKPPNYTNPSNLKKPNYTNIFFVVYRYLRFWHIGATTQWEGRAEGTIVRRTTVLRLIYRCR